MFEKFYRAVFFSIFSLIGILSVSLAIIGPEWKHLYRIKAATAHCEQGNAKIEQLLDDHQSLINLIKSEPNVLMRIAPAELGEMPQDPNAFVTKLSSDALSQAKAVIEQTAAENAAAESTQVPQWLLRATLDSSRIILFTAGAGLILVSFVCFSTPAVKSKKD